MVMTMSKQKFKVGNRVKFLLRIKDMPQEEKTGKIIDKYRIDNETIAYDIELDNGNGPIVKHCCEQYILKVL